MKKSLKKALALIFAAATLLSAAACSKAPENEKGKENETVINSGNAEAGADAEAVRAEIKQKAADIIATLEVGKTYDEMPIIAKKLGVNRFKVVETFLNSDGEMPSEGKSSNSSVSHYADVSDKDNMIYSRHGKADSSETIYWFVGDDYAITQVYYQIGNELDTLAKSEWRNLEIIPRGETKTYPVTKYIALTGYDVWSWDENIDELDFTYLGKDAILDYPETLVFEAIDGVRYHKYYIDPETGFCVLYHHNSGIEKLYDGISYYFYMSKVEIEPDEQMPEFTNGMADETKVYKNFDEALNLYLDAINNRDASAAYELTVPMDRAEMALESFGDFIEVIDEKFGKNAKINMSFMLSEGPVNYEDSLYADEINGTVIESRNLLCSASADGKDIGEGYIEAYNLEEYGWRFIIQ